MHHICIDVYAFRCSVFDITSFQLLNIPVFGILCLALNKYFF